MRGIKVTAIEIPTSIWQFLISIGMLMTCGTIIQHAFRGLIFPYKSFRIVTYESSTERFTAKFTRTVYFGAFSWIISLGMGAMINQATLSLGGEAFVQSIASSLSFSTVDAYTLFANAILIVLVTPIMCIVGSCLRKKSGIEYTERMRLRV